MGKTESEKQTILIVDDSAMNRTLLADMLGEDYIIAEACNGLEAIAIMQSQFAKISLVLLDVAMPKMDGLEVLAVMNKRGWIKDLPVIMVSAETSSSVIDRAYSLGVTDFVSRPFDSSIVRRRVLNTLILYSKQKELVDMVEDQIFKREKSVSMMVSILSQIVEFRNGESGLHVLHVNTMTEMLLQQINRKSDKYNFSPTEIGEISIASSLHDIGKIAVPEHILNKPGRLTPEEFDAIKTHSVVGARMLEDLPNYKKESMVKHAYEICRWHHERYDGSGYPDGLKGDEIPISAQVVALADVYDALISERVYKPALTHDQAVEMIQNGECGAFNPFLLECFMDIADEIHEQLHISSFSGYTLREAERVADLTVRSDMVGKPSNRTLELLEYERMKFNFFAKMSKEVQFEFTPDPPIALIADWSVFKLGLPEIIHDPYNNQQLIDMFGREEMNALFTSLRKTTPDNPIVEMDVIAHVGLMSRWFHLAARALWVETVDGIEYGGSIGKLVDIQDSHERISELERRTMYDSMTELINHNHASLMVSELMKEHQDDKFVIIVLDMDKFKEANDTKGHLFGDEVLKCLAHRLREAVRDSDIVARVGGDEFLICMKTDVDPEPLVDRIYNSVIGDFEGFPISVSMGVVCGQGSAGTYKEFFHSADKSLYEMKRAGRGGYVFGELERWDDNDSDNFTVVSKIDDIEV